MNQFVERLHGTIAQVAQAAKVLAFDSTALSEVSRAVKSGSQEQNGQAASAASAVEEMSATVERVNTDSQELVSYADSILRTSQEIGELSAEIKMQIDKFKIQ